MKRPHPAQRGFAAVAAVFLVVILAALGAFMVTFSNTQHLNSAQDVQGTRAYWAAQAGVEWAIAHLVALPSATPASPPAAAGTAPDCSGYPAALEGFTLTVVCPAQEYREGANWVRLFRITSTAKSTGAVGSLGYIEREVSATIEFTSP
jgi:MSHA biogenesis protein MshP